jgi:hypothetical protein
MPARKRSFDEFAAPLPRFKWGAPYLHNNKPDGTPRYSSESIKPNMKPNYIHALKRSHDQLATVKAFLDHGVDPEKLISGLTNKIHTIFRQNCRCKYTKDCCCLWRMRRNFPEKKIRLVQVPEIASPAPRDNFFVEAMMRLATKWINSDPGRQFVSALMDCGPGGQEFHASPRKHLSAEREGAVIVRLLDIAPRVFVHFREFSKMEDRPGGENLLGYMRRQWEPPGSAHIVMNVEKILGYDSSAPNYDQHTVNDLRRSIIRSAGTLCHELAHAISFLEVHVPLEPKFNNERFAEVGHAFENYLFGGTLNDTKLGGLWLNQWPAAGRLSGYEGGGLFRNPIYAHNAPPIRGGQLVDPKVYGRLLSDHFWNSKKDEPGDRRRRCKPFKKTWLRPYYEAPRTVQEFIHFFTGYGIPPLRENQAKRRRLVGTRGECPRWMDKRTTVPSTIEKSRRVQWLRRKEKMEERKDEFHERELLKAKKFAAKLDAVVEMLERF